MFEDAEEIEDAAENTVTAVTDRSLARADGAWHDENRLRRDILILLTRLDALEADTARLDWLESAAADSPLLLCAARTDTRGHRALAYGKPGLLDRTLREALDAARAAHPDTPTAKET